MSFQTARIRSGMSQSDIARYLGITRQAVNYWEEGKTYPNANRLLEIAALLQCTVEEILRRD